MAGPKHELVIISLTAKREQGSNGLIKATNMKQGKNGFRKFLRYRIKNVKKE